MKIFSCRSSGCSWAFRHRGPQLYQHWHCMQKPELGFGLLTYLLMQTRSVCRMPGVMSAWFVNFYGNLRWCIDIHRGNKDLYYCSIHFCWLYDIIPNKINSNLNCHCQLGEPKKQSWSIASVHLLHCFSTNTDSVSQLEPRQQIRCLDFNSAGLVT